MLMVYHDINLDTEIVKRDVLVAKEVLAGIPRCSYHRPAVTGKIDVSRLGEKP